MIMDEYKYTCRKCGAIQIVKTFDEIVSNRKLCYSCISDRNKSIMVKKAPKKRKKHQQVQNPNQQYY